ncbi:SRPBCC domain-containing protein [Flavobacterium sp. FlaQc-48]|uniref:SRPBCC domain-containing protein n=1 Tax=Flavobacterium sp. FlaQc-48 TaxID=3374181 RepID=UPI003757D2DE
MITVQNTISAAIDKVWKIWTIPEHIQKWNNAYDSWHTPYAENDLKVGGKFKYTMAAKDKSLQFDFEGWYTKVEQFSIIEYKLVDGRTGSVHFESIGNKVKITEVFEPEAGNPENMQKEWCQNVIDNFKTYVESF